MPTVSEPKTFQPLSPSASSLDRPLLRHLHLAVLDPEAAGLVLPEGGVEAAYSQKLAVAAFLGDVAFETAASRSRHNFACFCSFNSALQYLQARAVTRCSVFQGYGLH